MSAVWTEEMRQALDRSGDVPARVEVAGLVHVLLLQDDYSRVRELVPGLPSVVSVSNPVSQRQYALVPWTAYQRIRPLFEEDPLSEDERRAVLRRAGLRAGWNDPIWDDFDTPPAQP